MPGVTGWWAESFIEQSGIPSGEAFGTVAVLPGGVALYPEGIPSAEAFGSVSVPADVVVYPSGIPSGEAFGAATVLPVLQPAGIPSAEAFGTAAVLPGGVAVQPAGIPSAEAFGSATVVDPVFIDQAGTPGSEQTGNVTCTISPSAGADVLVFVWCTGGANSCYLAHYGGTSGGEMKFLGRVKFNGGQLVAFLRENVGAGSPTITINKTGFDWAQAVALSYSGASSFKLAKIAKGSGTTASHTATPSIAGRSIQSFTRAGSSGSFTSLSGGTNRVNDSSSLVAGTVSDTNSSGTFSGTLTSSANWGSLVIDAVPSASAAPKINYVSGLWSEQNSGSYSFDVNATIDDYIIVDVIQDRAGDPSSVTCNGTAMTLMDTSPFTTGLGTGFIKRYRSAKIASPYYDTSTIALTTNGSGWFHVAAVSISNVTSFGTATKTSGTSSAPSQAVTCAAGQLILQSFATTTAATDITGTNLFDSPSGSQSFLYMNAAEETTTFGISNTMNWGALATVIS
ncbi:hypothetical protein [Mycobacterium sp. 96-892]|uniref:hypothetical protein n=1 Tax=Mycobacterium sp. 96-892 TaxID=1855664 RepID=UPI000993099D|nr:hypothetical protein [Mycobacterium sp. 96-892]